jgi:hypothetical protein
MKDNPTPAPRPVASLFDEVTARRVASLLADEMIPAEVVPRPPQLWDVLVPAEFLDRACIILEASQPSDPELSYLATGEL